MRLSLFLLAIISFSLNAQTLKIRNRKAGALNGSQFAASISNTSLTLKQREQIIYKAIKAGNIPQFYRQLIKITDSVWIDSKKVEIEYYVLPDYMAIGTDTNYFYCPMTPALAQRVANKLKCSLPTRKMVNNIYQHAAIKLKPLPIPPSAAMVTVPVFIAHNNKLRQQWDSLNIKRTAGCLVAGNKKDVIISNRIYNDISSYHVVIYGWHIPATGKPIQPLYARHLNTWADYSHGIRLIAKKVWVNGEATTIKKVLKSTRLSTLLSDEGVIKKPYYPTKTD